MDSEKLRELLDGDEEFGGVDVNYRKYVDYDDTDDDFDIESIFNDDKSDEKAAPIEKKKQESSDDADDKTEAEEKADHNKNDLSETNVIEEKIKKPHNKLKITGAICIFCAIIVVTAYICISYVFYANRFVPSTVINGFDCSNRTVEDVYEEINSSLENYSLSILLGGIESDKIYGSDIELQCGEYLKSVLTDICNNQKKYSWLKGFFVDSDEIYVDDGLELSYNKLDEILDNSLIMSITPTIKSEDAGIIYNGQEFEIKPAVYGDEIDKTAVRDLVIKKIQCLENSLDVAMEGCYVQPTLTEDDKKLSDACSTANDYIEKSIALTVFDTTQILDKSALNKWIAVNFNADVVANEDEIREYVRLLDDTYSTLNKIRTFKTHYGDSVTVSGGDYGRKLDTAKLIDDLCSAVIGFDDAEVKAEFTSSAMGPVSNDIGTSYIEVDLTNQKLWMYKNGKQIVETDIVSGKNDGSHNTPLGVYKIKDKKNNTVLKTEGNRSVSYWIPFTGNIGINDASWQSEFGGSVYTLNGSNGSIYIPSDAAKAIYNNAVKDMPVVCYFHSLVVDPTDASASAAIPPITMPVIEYPPVIENNNETETHVVEGFTEAAQEKETAAQSNESSGGNAENTQPETQKPETNSDNIIHEETIPPLN